MRQSAAYGERTLALPTAMLEGGHDEGPGHCNARCSRGPGRRRGMGRNLDRAGLVSGRCLRQCDFAIGHAGIAVVLARADAHPTGDGEPNIGGRRPGRDLGDADGRRDGDVVEDDLGGEPDGLRTGETTFTKVVFSGTWAGGAKTILCKATAPSDTGDWRCQADLLALGVPPGKVTFSFDVFGVGVPTVRSPDGPRRVDLRRPAAEADRHPMEEPRGSRVKTERAIRRDLPPEVVGADRLRRRLSHLQHLGVPPRLDGRTPASPASSPARPSMSRNSSCFGGPLETPAPRS